MKNIFPQDFRSTEIQSTSGEKQSWTNPNSLYPIPKVISIFIQLFQHNALSTLKDNGNKKKSGSNILGSSTISILTTSISTGLTSWSVFYPWDASHARSFNFKLAMECSYAILLTGSELPVQDRTEGSNLGALWTHSLWAGKYTRNNGKVPSPSSPSAICESITSVICDPGCQQSPSHSTNPISLISFTLTIIFKTCMFLINWD